MYIIFLLKCQAHVNQIIGYINKGPTIICTGKEQKALCCKAYLRWQHCGWQVLNFDPYFV
jgi:hypothetical protein